MTHHRSTIGLVAVAGLAACVSAQTDIFWDAGDGVWSDSANWDPMISPSLLTHNAFINSAGVTVSLDATRTINDLTIGSPTATLVIDPVRTLGLAGNMHNLGLILVNPTTSANNSIIRFDGPDAQLTGAGGVLRLSGGAGGLDAQLNTGAGGMLTNNAGHTIDGSGVVNAMLVNEGLVLASDSGFESVMSLQGADKFNNADIEADTNATLNISSIVLTQGPAGRIHARDGGLVELSGTNTIIGGDLGSTNTGLVRRLSGTTTLDGVTLDATLDVLPVGTVSVLGPDFVHTGLIILNDTTSANNAVLNFASDCTVVGTGSVLLGGGFDDSQVNTDGGVTVTFGAGITVEGSGQVNAAFINNGLVRAIPTPNGGASLVLQNGAKENNAQLIAETDAELVLSGVPLAQGAAGELTADGGTVVLAGTNSVSGGTIRSINGGLIVRNVSGTTTLDGAAIDAIIDVQLFSTLAVMGPELDHRGQIILNDSTDANNAVLNFASDCTVVGTGSVLLGGGFDDSQVNTDGGVTVTFGAGITVEGSGQVNAAFINNGLVRAIPTPNGGAALVLQNGAKANNAQIVAETDAELELLGTSLTQGAVGELTADGGTVVLTGTNSVSGGTIRSINGGLVVRNFSGTTTLDGAALDAIIDVQPFSTLAVMGPVLDHQGQIILNDSTSANNAVLNFASDCTVVGGGTVFLGGGSDDSQVNTDGGVTVTFDPGTTIEGSGQVNAAFINNGLVRAIPTPNGGASLVLQNGAKENNAQLIAETDAELVLSGVPLAQGTAGELTADGGTVVLAGTNSVSGGTIRSINGGLVVRNFSGTSTLDNVIIEGEFDVVPPSTVLVTSSVFDNRGTIYVNNTTSANDSVLRFSNDCTLTGGGTVFLGGGSNDSQVNTDAPARLTVDATSTIEGEGQLNGIFTIEGTIKPGLPVGPLTGSMDLTFEASATYHVEASSASNADRINTTGTIQNGGTIQVVARDGYTPQLNDQFNIITAAQVTGLFDDITFSGAIIAPDIALRAVYTPTSVDIRFVCIADLAPPYGVLDLADIAGFTSAFLAQDPLADLAEPFGVFDLADIGAFIQAFLSGCE